MRQPNNKGSTFFGLLAEFNTTQIPLADCCEAYFGCNERHANELAAARRLPVPAFRMGSQKSQWFIHAGDLAEHVERQRSEAALAWQTRQAEREASI